MKSILTNLCLTSAAIVVGFLAVEGSLRLLDAGGMYKSGISRISDSVLRYRLPPNLFPEIDSDGYRNPSNKGPFDIVILGDSHVYSYGVSASDSFPRQLAQLTGKSVYNFGMGGYGPAQYAFLTDRALALNPKTLVVSLFMGNDPINACEIANLLEYWRTYFEYNNLVTENCGNKPVVVTNTKKNTRSQIKAWLKGTRTGSLINQYLWLPLRNRASILLHSDENNIEIAINDGDLQTIFPVWPNNTQAASDGIKITKYFLTQIKIKSMENKTSIVLAFFPSKQNVYLDILNGKGVKVSTEFVESVKAERRFIFDLMKFGRDQGFKIANASAPLLAAAAAKTVLYPPDDDSHPTPIGYLVYAQTVARQLP